MKTAIDISYGKGHLAVRLPEHARPTMVRKPVLPKIADPRGAIRRVLDEPLSAAPASSLARRRGVAVRVS